MATRFAIAACACFGLGLLGSWSPASAQTEAKQPTQPQPVQLKITVPKANAELTIEGAPTRQTGVSRTFVSPAIEPGKNFAYNITVTWRPNNYTTITRTKKVPVKAGQDVEVDLTKAEQDNPDKIVIRWVPTPDEVVTAMCKMAGVNKEDVVYDLGCGDGRIVIAAVKEFGAKRGVGVDIDEKKIAESKENAVKQGVKDKVEFRANDVLDIKDIGDANVVMLYMGEDVNIRLKPILQKTLKPGSRIVSHRFLMGDDWKPLKTETVTDSGGNEYDIHLWKIGEPEKK